MKIKKLRELRREDYALIVTILLTIIVTVWVFMIHHVPIKEAYYDEKAKELVISPGWFYTLEGYQCYSRTLIPREFLLPLHEPSDQVYRFRGVLEDDTFDGVFQIYCRDSLTGKHESVQYNITYTWDRRANQGSYWCVCVYGDADSLRFTIYPEE